MSTVPQSPVEARSLSTVTNIASNPPAYPRNPAREKHEPLSLYIVRVPGSKDIFLSTLKPPTKSSVSAEAINASLYYLHVATPEDDTLLQEVEAEREEQAQLHKERLERAGVGDPAQREFARLNNVRRKPVGGGGNLNPVPLLAPPQQDATAPPALPPRPIPMPQVTAENVSFSGTPVAYSNTQPPSSNYMPGGISVESGGKSSSPRRPLPPLPPGEESWTNSAGGEDPPKSPSRWSAFAEQLQTRGENWREKYEAKYEALSAGRHSLDSTRPPMQPLSSPNCTGLPLESSRESPNRPRNTYGNPPSNAGFHITLIRRDPASGTQWNVATISTPRMDRNTVDIEISTPGYNRFAGPNEIPSLSSLAANLPTGIGRLPSSAISQSPATEQPKEQPTGPRKFRRQLCVSKPFDDSIATDGSNGHTQGSSSSSKLKSGYYTFTSPWNGTCTFTNSVNGRSLKCKHMIPTPGGFVPSNGETEAPPAVTVAEIRFNTPFQAANLHSHAHHAIHKPHPNHLSPFTQSQLQTQSLPHLSDDNNSGLDGGPLHPSSSNNSNASAKRNSLSQLLNPNNYASPLPASTPTDPRASFSPSSLLRRTSLRAQRFARQSQFNPASRPHSRRSMSNSSGGDLDHDSDDDRLDLSLAREPAGGGLRGKSAKLGKLVIEDEGIKMLDLVVAACMAVWWRGYY
ncbi:metal homeostatis protein BSD2 [Penicillium digitatum]|uniref:Oxidoreductase-like protein n=3 Tax=Penicillium digitatum TaxID=36651 RepID=K9FH51_PEND2|nr:hypothetical protein PDIP_43760 [Penicillium digitatum Pd1]EKV07467.1 hypothetical protein PDIG_73280 [Penicillium digitatum PHI26]EKV14446.1 hypothetical protein PDIP_43760 [Penicillium digitatum Pd1]KAG0159856.1 hypothetical protein PDIDSM_7383 [Penicillium digitatum]QQK46037.1 metal homeostatis protein BSD2 [Penicillium digitatum]